MFAHESQEERRRARRRALELERQKSTRRQIFERNQHSQLDRHTPFVRPSNRRGFFELLQQLELGIRMRGMSLMEQVMNSLRNSRAQNLLTHKIYQNEPLWDMRQQWRHFSLIGRPIPTTDGFIYRPFAEPKMKLPNEGMSRFSYRTYLSNPDLYEGSRINLVRFFRSLGRTKQYLEEPPPI